MLLRLCAVLFLGVTLSLSAKAQTQNAVGLTLGGPTFIHFTHNMGQGEAAEIGVSFSYNNASHIYGDYLIETHRPFSNPRLNDFGLFYGIGGIVVINNKERNNDNGYYGNEKGEAGIGARFPVGIDWRPPEAKDFSFHVQLVPTVAIAPETELEFTAGIGLKYHF